MANIKSAKKRILITKRNNVRNKTHKSIVKTYIKKYLANLDQFLTEPTDLNRSLSENSLSEAYQKIDKAHKLNILHKNTAARKKSKLSLLLRQALQEKNAMS